MLGLDKKIVKKDKYVLRQKMEMVLVDYIYPKQTYIMVQIIKSFIMKN